MLTIAFSYASAAISYLVQFWLARKLGDEDFGVFSFAILIANILQTTLLFGSDRTLVRDLVQAESPRRVFRDSCWLRLALTFVLIPLCTIAILTSSESLASQRTLLFGLGFGVASALTPMGWFDFRGKMHVQSALLLLEKILFGAGVVVASVWLQISVSPILAAGIMTIAAAIGLLSQWLLITPDIGTPEPGSSSQIKRMVFSNLAVVFAALGNMCMTHANQLVLISSIGKTGLAHYSIAFQLTRIVHLFLGQYIRICSPDIARSTTLEAIASGRGRSSFFGHLWQSTAVAASITLPLYLVGRLAILWFLPPDFIPAIAILFVLCGWCIVFGAASVINRYLLCLHLQNWFLVSAVLFGLFSIAISFWLVPLYGGIGAALALLIGHSASAVFQALFVVRALQPQ
jgi:PST family polysaccharide transporter